MTAVIIDDEAGSRNNLKFLLETFCPEITLLGWAENAVGGLEIISNHQPDLVFLDIEMPEQDGFQMIEQLPASFQSKIIFTTAYEQYAIKAFKVSALDYLLKPIDIEDLKETLQRTKVATAEETSIQLGALKKNLENGPQKLVISHQTGLTFLNEEDIICLEAKRNYTEINLKSAKKLLISKNLGEFEDLLADSPSFFRAHRSFIINLQYMEQWVNKDGGYLLMSNDLQVPLARNRKAHFFKIIHNFRGGF